MFFYVLSAVAFLFAIATVVYLWRKAGQPPTKSEERLADLEEASFKRLGWF